jgi:hypothetical protein
LCASIKKKQDARQQKAKCSDRERVAAATICDACGRIAKRKGDSGKHRDHYAEQLTPTEIQCPKSVHMFNQQ